MMNIDPLNSTFVDTARTAASNSANWIKTKASSFSLGDTVSKVVTAVVDFFKAIPGAVRDFANFAKASLLLTKDKIMALSPNAKLGGAVAVAALACAGIYKAYQAFTAKSAETQPKQTA